MSANTTQEWAEDNLESDGIALPPPTDSPAMRGMQERLGIIEKVALGGRAWRYATYGCLGIIGLLVGGVVYLGALPKWKPYYVELDTCRGDVRVVGAAPETLSFRELNVRHFLSNFVMDIRGVSDSIETTKAQWRRLSHQVTKEGKILLNQTEAREQPLTKKDPIVVKIIRVQQREGTRYDVRWQETRFDGKNGGFLETVNYGGLFTFHWDTPRTEDERQQAPLGMFFHMWQWGKE